MGERDQPAHRSAQKWTNARVRPLTLLCLSRHLGTPLEQLKEFSSHVALKTTPDLPRGLAFCHPTSDICHGWRIAPEAGKDDGMKSAVELTVTAPIQAVSPGLPGRSGDGGDPCIEPVDRTGEGVVAEGKRGARGWPSGGAYDWVAPRDSSTAAGLGRPGGSTRTPYLWSWTTPLPHLYR